MNFLNLGNNTGWLIDSETEVDSQQEKEDAVLYLTERALETLEKVVSIYVKFGDKGALEIFQARVDERMKSADLRKYFNKENE